MGIEQKLVTEVFSRIEKIMRDLLAETGGERIEVESTAIAIVGQEAIWITTNGKRSPIRNPSKLSFAVDDLREAQVDPHRGAWTYSRLWMEAADGVLHQESDWMREPVINGDPAGDQDAAVELRLHPRDPEFIPEWMATKAAAFHKKEEARARRRERDRARRERKKAEAAQATQEAATHTANTNEDGQ